MRSNDRLEKGMTETRLTRIRWLKEIKATTGISMQKKTELTRQRMEWMMVIGGRLRPDGTRSVTK